MTTIYNSELSKELTIGAAVQTSRDKIPTQLAEKVVPVMEVNPKLLRRMNFIYNASKTTTAASTIVTTSTSKDTFLTGVTLSWTCDAACDSTQYYLDCYPDYTGALTVIALQPKQTTTAGFGTQTIEFNPPLKIKRNTAIRHGTTFAAGTTTMNSSLRGYVIDNPEA